MWVTGLRHRLWLGLLLAVWTSAGYAADRINVLACEPEWEALAKEIGGNNLKTYSMTTAFQDPHRIEARPSLIAKSRKADLIICTGSELEVGWLPLLLRQSGNPRIQLGKPGYFLASEVVERLEIPEKLDRSLGDIHASGNPHVHLDPHRLLSIAEALSERLNSIDPKNSERTAERLKSFKTKWQLAIKSWEEKSAPLKGKKVIVYHRSWSYFFAWLGIEKIGDIEPKPGLPPTSAHLAKLLSVGQREKADFILIAAYQNTRGANWLGKKLDTPVLRLPFTVGGNKEATDLFGLYDSSLNILLSALK